MAIILNDYSTPKFEMNDTYTKLFSQNNCCKSYLVPLKWAFFYRVLFFILSKLKAVPLFVSPRTFSCLTVILQLLSKSNGVKSTFTGDFSHSNPFPLNQHEKSFSNTHQILIHFYCIVNELLLLLLIFFPLFCRLTPVISSLFAFLCAIQCVPPANCFIVYMNFHVDI